MRRLLSESTTLRWAAPLAVFVVLALMPWIGVSVLWQRNLELVAVYALIVSGLNLSFGYAGELALGQVAVFAVGAYATGILASHGTTDILLALAISLVAAGILGLVSGAPGLRLSSWTLALVSFFLVLLVPEVVTIFSSQTGGPVGLPGVLNPKLFGAVLQQRGYYLLVITVAAVGMVGFRNLVTSRYGLALRSLRESPVLLGSLGVSTYQLRMSAYVLGGVPAGLAGCLYAYLTGYIDPTTFSFSLAVAVLAASVVGGAESVWGAPVGAALLVLGPMQAGSFQRYSLLVYGVFLIVMGVLFAGGLAALARRSLSRRLTPADAEAQVTKPGRSLPLPVKITGDSLVATEVVKNFGGNRALDGVELEAAPGSITAILGPNGAGKTTLLNAISGLVRVDAGHVTLGTDQLAGLSPKRVARAGVGRTFQTPQIPETMTVEEIVTSGRLRVHRLGITGAILRLPRYRASVRSDRVLVQSLLEFAGLESSAARPGRTMPLGTRRLLEVLRSVVSQPNVILLDEPAAGLDGEALKELAALLRQLRDAGASIIIVEHNVPFVLGLADKVYVMDLGAVIASGSPEDIRRHPDVIKSYLGPKLAERLANREQSPQSVTKSSNGAAATFGDVLP